MALQESVIDMLNLFRSKPPSIPTHESRITVLGQQIADCERDLQDAETRAVNAAIDGTGLAEVTAEVVRLKAELSALQGAKTQVENELAALRAAAAEAEASRRKAEAQVQMLDLAAEMQATADEVKPYLHRISAQMQTADRWLETFTSQNISPSLYAMDGAIGTLKSLANQVRMSAESITAPVDEHGAHNDTATRVLALPYTS